MRHSVLARACIWVVWMALLAGGVGLGAGEAHAQAKAKAEITAKRKAAMESYDMLDFDAAKKQLGEALTIARKAGLADDPAVARVYLDLGVVLFAGLKDEKAARNAFAEALKRDPEIQIDVAYRTEAMAAALAEVKSGGGDEPAAEPEPAAGKDCASLEGVAHELVETADQGEDIPVEADVGDALAADTVILYYRVPGAATFTKVPMKKGDGCRYRGEIPAAATEGDAIHYYVAALVDGKVADSRGSSGSPNIIELGRGGAGGGSDGENPLGDSVEVDAAAGGKKTMFLAVAIGSGAGYVTGETEVAGSDVGCCFAPALFHVMPEIGYYFSRRTSAALAVRMGFAIGANIPGHATAAPAVLAKLRHTIEDDGEGVVLMAAVGGGIIRNTIKVEDAAAGMDTDTTASGPVMAGAGIGYGKTMSGPLRFIGELSALAAFPAGIKELGTCPGAGCVKPNFGFQFDFNLGMQLAF